MPTKSRFVRPRGYTVSRRLHRLIASLPLAFALHAPVSAQTTLSWSSTGSSTLGGDGSWSASGFNWWNGAGAVAWPASGTSNQALFSGTAGTVSLDAAIAANALRFTANGYVLSGGQTLTLNGSAPFISVSGSTVSATLGNNTALVLAGTAGLAKTGTGTLTLSGSAPHSVTGGVTVNGGTLLLSLANLATPADLVPATNTLTLGTGTLTVTGKSTATASQTF
nr:autotransporter-associated beta strand repeat-containing protein [Opitutaceae bacterium]